ncbi:glycosyltransferase family 39 protein [Paenibacillus sp. GYB003]|uniref:glycosyltransferase family 39 protein n=1 Tax=Paenibacillus sp. GYB003 TaxID=2994392 RepID=UPI002F961D0E
MLALYHKLKHRDFVLLVPLVALSLYVRLRYFFFLASSGKGFPDAADSQWYLAYARSLMTDFKIGLHMNDLLYFGYNMLLTVLLMLFKDPVAILFIQAVTAGLSVILVFKIARMLFNRTTAVIASILYGYSWDITLWTTYILTDSFFISLLLLCVFLLLKSFESGKTAYKALFVASAAYLFIFRPTGILSLLFILIYIAIRMDKPKALRFVRRHKYTLGGIAAALVAVGAYALFGGKLAPLVQSLQYNAKLVLYNIYARGWVYDQPTPGAIFYKPDYTIDIGNSLILSFLVHNWDHVAAIYARRVVAFLGRWVWLTDLSTFGGIKTFVSNMVPTALFVAGFVASIVNGIFKKASIVWLCILAIFIFCIVLFIDGMYRYRAPSIPFIAIAVAYGADSVARAAFAIGKKAIGKLPWKRKSTNLKSGL